MADSRNVSFTDTDSRGLLQQPCCDLLCFGQKVIFHLQTNEDNFDIQICLNECLLKRAKPQKQSHLL
jgi:hypothetical protein